ncbi:MAG: hypothetical protein AAGA62_05550, partial [Bacteroidota bacterium]
PEVNTGADQSAEKLSLTFSATRNAKRVELTFWSRWTAQGWEFYRIEGASRTVECECVGQLMRPTDDEWDGILNRVIDRYYADLFQLPKQVGGRSSVAGDPELPSWQQELRAALKEELRANAVSDLPMLNDSTVIIPFLGEEIEVRRSGGIYTGKVSQELTDTTRFTDVDALTAGQLPIDISDRLNQLGITDGALPENARLYVTGFKMGSQQGAWTAAKMELTLFYQLYDYGADAYQYLRFVRDSIDIGPEQVDMTDLFLELENHGKLPTNGGDMVHFGLENAAHIGDSAPTHAKLSCDGGFSHFEVAGLYQAFYESDPESNRTKLLVKKPMEGRDYLDATKRAEGLFLPFTVDTRNTPTHSLGAFIVPIDSRYRGGEKSTWRFSAKGSEQVVFLPGSGFSGFIDLDPNAAPDEALEGDSGDKVNDPGFIGLAFKNIHFRIQGLNDKGSEPLTFMLEDLAYVPGEGLTMSEVYKVGNPVTKGDDRQLGGWDYTLYRMDFHIKDGAMQANILGEEGVLLAGSMRIPIFSADPPSTPEYEFSSGYVKFEGTLGFASGGNQFFPTSTMVISGVGEHPYYSAFIPGMGYDLGEGSEVSLNYSIDNDELEPGAVLNGKSGLYLVSGVLNAAEQAMTGNDIPDLMKKVNLVFNLLTFEGFAINQIDGVASQCQGSETIGGIKALDFGTWGINNPFAGGGGTSRYTWYSRVDSINTANGVYRGTTDSLGNSGAAAGAGTGTNTDAGDGTTADAGDGTDTDTGGGDTGDGDTGDGDTGDGDTGDGDAGGRDTGDGDAGDGNTGGGDTGDGDAGDGDTGGRDTGDGDAGDGDTGDG